MRSTFIYIFLICCSFIHAQTPIEYYQRGDSLVKLGLYQEAIKNLKAAEKNEHRFLKNRKQLLYGNLAYSYQELGEYRTALKYYDKQLEVLGEKSVHKDAILLNMTDLYLLTGEYNKVINILGKISKESAKKEINLASAYCMKGKTEEALQRLNQLTNGTDLSLAEKEISQTQLAAFQNKAYILSTIGKQNEAYQILTQLLPHIKKESEYYQALGNYAIIESAIGQKDNALKHINQCIKWQKDNLGSRHNDLAISIRKKAEILMDWGETNKAEISFKQFYNIEKKNIFKNFAFLTEKQRCDYWASKKDLIAECYRLGYQNPKFLFDVAVFSKSVLLQSNKSFYKLVSKNNQLLKEYNRISLFRNKVNKETGAKRDSLETILENDEYNLLNKIDDWKSFSRQMNITGKDVAASLPRSSDQAIEFIRVKEKDSTVYAALIINPQGNVKYIPIIAEKKLSSYILHNKPILGTLQEAIESNRDNDKDNIYSDSLLGKLIWEKIMQNVPRKGRVFFSAEGIFHLLGIEYLNFDRPDCTIYRLSSTRYLCERRKTKHSPSILLLGGIDYSKVKNLDTQENPDRFTSQLLAEEQMPPIVGGGYEYLPGSLVEVDSIATIFPKKNIQLLTGNSCDETYIKNILGNFNIIHISTHGYSTNYQILPLTDYNKDKHTEDLSMASCGILLSGANNLAQQNDSNRYYEDGIISASEISNLNLQQVDMAVLSACQTGLGKVTSDGVFGMSRGLKKANVGALVVSLWEVNDEATQNLMCSFYNNLKSNPDKQRALRLAQQRLKETTFAQPHFWAAFILIDGF